MQRFISEDPIGLWGGFNFYIMTDNNPVNLVDPLGLKGGSGCKDDDCWAKCLAADPLFRYLVPFSILPAVNFKTPGEMRPGASPFTSIDRRLPGWTGANPNAGATVTRGSIGRIKYVGRYGTAAAAIGTFATSYSGTAMIRCWIECGE